MGRPDGTTTKVSRSGLTPTGALAALELVLAEQRRGILDPEDSIPTLGDLIAWVVERIEQGRDPKVKSPNSILKYTSIARLWGGHPAPEFDESTMERRSHLKETVQHESRVHGIRIDRLTPADLADELERVAALGAGSLPHLRALWRKATARAIALRHITIDPAVGLPLPKPTSAPSNRVYKNGARRPLNNSLTDAQLATLREEVKVKHPQQRLDVADLIILGSYTGLRINEANSLRWEDVHLGEKQPFLTVEGQVYGSGADRTWEPLLKRESSRRTVPLPPAAVELLRARNEKAGIGRRCTKVSDPAVKFVFPAQTGGVPDAVTARKAVRRKLDRAGFPWATFHTLRRTVERQLMDANVDPRVIMAVMGHDPATSWASYVDHKSVDVGAAAEALA
ncbi:tyrosine-type recombinase/integrase [Brachybacterium paraconglomeratum]|uniref:tyrosine-type recombinase/integrase n=1 Tax=Brachybacterium paraconglomeratum TaxID=173362 RepID=UPI0037C7C9EA